jgi:hypothetical protein
MSAENGHKKSAAPDTAAGGRDGRRERRRRPRLRSRERPAAAPAAGGRDEALEELQGELMLLREENARLKALQHHPPDAGRLLSKVRSMSAERAEMEEIGDQAAQAIADGLVMRQTLLDVCQEIELLMVTMGARLEALASEWAPDPVAGELDIEPDESERNGLWSASNGSTSAGAEGTT